MQFELSDSLIEDYSQTYTHLSLSGSWELMKHHFTPSQTEAAHYSVNVHTVNSFLSLQFLIKPVRFQTDWCWLKVTRVCLCKRSVQGSSQVPVVTLNIETDWGWRSAQSENVSQHNHRQITQLFFVFFRTELNWMRERPNLFRPIKSCKWHIRSEVLLWERNDHESTLLERFCDSSIQ